MIKEIGKGTEHVHQFVKVERSGLIFEARRVFSGKGSHTAWRFTGETRSYRSGIPVVVHAPVGVDIEAFMDFVADLDVWFYFGRTVRELNDLKIPYVANRDGYGAIGFYEIEYKPGMEVL